jgi:hypothetical protein
MTINRSLGDKDSVLYIRGIDTKLKAAFKALCAIQEVTLEFAILKLIHTALEKNRKE